MKHPSAVTVNTVLITGVTGFIGTSLSRHLQESGWTVRGLSRKPKTRSSPVDMRTIQSLDELSADHPALEDVDAVVHLAGRAHAPGMSSAEQETVFAADLAGTKRLATAAAQAGVRRFIFVSTAKVLGETSPAGYGFAHDSVPSPQDAYARYKLAAEDAVRACAEPSGMEWVVVRPVLVYGDGVKGNLASLLRWISKGYPLPFGGLENRRSLVALNDLDELLETCISSPGAAGERLLASGDDDLSTAEICSALAEGLARPARLVNIPAWTWRALRAFPLTSAKAKRLAGSFRVDNSRTKALTNWQPRTPAREGLAAVGRASLAGGKARAEAP